LEDTPAPDAGSDEPLAALQICAAPADSGSPWNITYPTPTSAVYACKTACPVQDTSACSYATKDWHWNATTQTSEQIHALSTLAFVVNGMGAELRWNEPVTTTAVLFHAAGGTGTSFGSEKNDLGGVQTAEATRVMWEAAIEARGIKLVELRWAAGAKATADGDMYTQGWFTRPDDTPRTLVWAAQRPALALRLVREQMVPAGIKLGTAGCSGGSVQTFAPVLWYELDAAVDYQYFSGPLPGAWDTPAVCGAAPQPSGLCEHDPSLACANDVACGAGHKCAFVQPTGALGGPNPLGEGVKAFIVDYVCNTTDCVDGRANACFNESSMSPSVQGARAGDFDLDHPIDVNVGVGGTPTFMTDTNLGVTYNGGKLFETVRCSGAACKRWSTSDGAVHCSAFKADHLDGTLATIRSGLGVQ
jgi:hypothetical protein